MHVSSVSYFNVNTASFGRRNTVSPEKAVNEHKTSREVAKLSAVNTAVAAAILASGIIMGMQSVPSSTESKNNISNFNAAGIPADVIECAKNSLPQPFSYTNDSIEALENKLNNNFVMSLKRINNENKLAALQKKKAEQDKIADMYSDGDFVYFKLHLTDDTSKYIENGSSGRVISAENFKKLFDIEDGALKDYNYSKLDFEWKKEDFDIPAYRDFTDAKLQDGAVYKVPKSSIKTDDINLDDFLIAD